ncbi:MAG: Na+/H+ antiporter NhaA [Thermoleophilia bacterium]
MSPEHQIQRPWSRSERTVPRAIVRPLREFLRYEASGGLVLLVATLVALIWANVDTASYEDLFATELDLRFGELAYSMDLRFIINDGLMTLFFLLIGLEVKRELTVGELVGRRAASLPLFAAIGGLAIPALVFAAVTAGGDGSSGWGIPIATDTAFALGVLALLARRAPPALTALLLGVAVIDDLGAMTVMSVFYSEGPHLVWLAALGGCLLAAAAMSRAHVRHLLPYLVIGSAAWCFCLAAGVHPTVVGVLFGLLTPARPFQPRIGVAREAGMVAEQILGGRDTREADAKPWRRLAYLTREAISPLNRIEHALHPWTSIAVVPIFALANAGIVLDRPSIDAALDSRVTLAVVLGLVIGKPLGLVLGAALAVRFGLSRRPPGVTWLHLVGLGGLAGIGFTISLFVTNLAFDDADLLSAAKVGILAGSVMAAVVGVVTLLIAYRRTHPHGAG